MDFRVTIALIGLLVGMAPGLAAAQDDEGDAEEGTDLDDLMEGNPEQGDDDTPAGGDGDDDPSVEKAVEDDFDANSMDDERPPEDPDAFIKPGSDEPSPDALEDGADNPFSVSLMLGYGVSMEDINPWGFGMGAQADYDLGLITLGVTFAYFLGESIDVVRYDNFDNPLGTDTYTFNLWRLGVNAGLDIDVTDTVTVRPQLGLGFATHSGQSETQTSAYFAPGVALLYDVSDSMYVGLDARYEAIASDPSIGGISFMAAVGMRF